MFAPFVLLPLIILTFLVSLVVGAAAISFAVIGGPAPCEPGGGPIVISEENAGAFQRKWDAFDAMLDAGSAGSVTLSESEVSSRAQRWINDEVDDDAGFLENVRICLHDGYGEASGTLDLPGFLDIKVKVRGTASITDELVINIDDFEIGSVPGFVENWLNDVPDEIAGTITDVDLRHTYIVSLRDGEVRIDGLPAGQAP